MIEMMGAKRKTDTRHKKALDSSRIFFSVYNRHNVYCALAQFY